MTNPNDPAYGVEAKQWVLTKQQWEKYPGLATDLQSIVERCHGLTKREHFAAMAMQGYLSSPNLRIVADILSHLSVQQADALIAELNKAEPK